MNQQTALGILKTGRNVFLTGSAGTGKTYLLNQYVNYLKERGIRPSIVAPTGIAASHIGGMTIHSFFGIGIQEYHDRYAVDRLLQKEFLYKRLSQVKVLIVDEISMVSPQIFSLMDELLRGFKYSTEPFGGVQLVLSGDFFQLPPVSRVGNTDAHRFAWQAGVWKSADLKSCYLHEKYRQSDESLIKILDEIRSGSVSEKSISALNGCSQKNLKAGFKISRLYTHNIDVDRINREELEDLDAPLKVFISHNHGSKKNLEKIFNSSLVAEELKLKKGAVVIFIKNNYEKGYVNGTLGSIIDFDKDSGLPVVKTFSGQKILAEQESWEFENLKGEIKAQIKQVPLRLAWALTVHKSQGMTLDGAEIDLSKTFETGQGYVALSRVKSIEGLKLLGFNDKALQVDKTILQIDRQIDNASKMFERKFESFSEEEKEKMYREFILKCGGSLKKIKFSSRDTTHLSSRAKSRDLNKKHTLEETKALLENKKSLAEIAKARELSPRTILNHIQKISEVFPDFDISYLKPKEDILNSVAQALAHVRARNRPEDFLDNGKIRLSALFERLRQNIPYDDIKLALVFLKKDKE